MVSNGAFSTGSAGIVGWLIARFIPKAPSVVVERIFNRIKQCRRVASRYDKLAANCVAFVQLASGYGWRLVNKSEPQSIIDTER